MRSFFIELHSRNRLLAWVGWIHIFALLLAVGLSTSDGRQILDLNAWVKPIKFLISAIAFLWTIAWFSRFVQASKALLVISAGVAIVMLLENGLIGMQAARGVTSHFNRSTPFDDFVFSLMGCLILINTLLVAWFLWLIDAPFLNRVYLLAIRLGLLMFLIGSIQGGLLLANKAHTVGMPDGGPGLPFVNWSTKGGDLRIAHFLGLHGLQIIPLVGWVLSRSNGSKSFQMAALIGFSVGYLGAFVVTVVQALHGIPLLKV